MFSEQGLAEFRSREILENLRTSGLNYKAEISPFTTRIKLSHKFLTDWSDIRVTSKPPQPPILESDTVDPDSFKTFQTDLLDRDSELLALKKSNSDLEKSLRDRVEELAVFKKERDGFENEISRLESAASFQANAREKLNTNFQNASSSATNFRAKLSEKTIECKNLELTKASLESLLSECKLKVKKDSYPRLLFCLGQRPTQHHLL